jgi:hypothetical protein
MQFAAWKIRYKTCNIDYCTDGLEMSCGVENLLIDTKKKT